MHPDAVEVPFLSSSLRTRSLESFVVVFESNSEMGN